MRANPDTEWLLDAQGDIALANVKKTRPMRYAHLCFTLNRRLRSFSRLFIWSQDIYPSASSPYTKRPAASSRREPLPQSKRGSGRFDARRSFWHDNCGFENRAEPVSNA